MPKSVYIHIPFCHHICPYCDFNKVVLEGQPVMDYLHALKREMDVTFERHPAQQIETIFVGGGTPTALNSEQMAYFLQSVQTCIPNQAANIEFTMEVNPGTIDQEKLAVMRENGVNRLSFGVQSFDPQLLKQLGRIHDVDDVFRSLELAKSMGLSNISIDLMFGLPNQTPDIFARTLDTAFKLDIPHFSAYSLKIEEGTHFHLLHEKGKLPLPPEDDEFHMYDQVISRMKEQGYRHYEISNFAKPGYESRHNLTYWKNEPYYGLGAGAHGYVHGVRHENAGPLAEYMQLVENKGQAHIDTHVVSAKEAMEDMMIMGLRLEEGISATHFRETFAVQLEEVYGQQLNELMTKGLLEQQGERFALTNKGIFFGNDVFVTFLGE